MRIFGINAGAADDPKCDTQKATTEWTSPSVAVAPSSAVGEELGFENGTSGLATGLWVVLIAAISVECSVLFLPGNVD